jgi:hypothetical protein
MLEDEVVQRYDDVHGGLLRARAAAEAVRTFLPATDQPSRPHGRRAGLSRSGLPPTIARHYRMREDDTQSR